ncbi:MAG: tail fiber domain-containing protein [Agriterribacter sp.]
MKLKKHAIGLLIISIIFYNKNVIGQANTTLSNLASPTAINQHLIPTSNNSLDIGTVAKQWRTIYAGTSFYLKGSRIIHAPGTTNFFTGPNSGNAATTGTHNTTVGDYTLASLTTGTYNTAMGFRALRSTTTGSRNTSSGYASLYNSTSGSYNSALGFASLFLTSTGSYNVAMGNETMYENTTGAHNVAIGSQAMYSNKTTNNQVALGDKALYSLNGGGGNNVAIGSEALYATNTGSYNTSAGNQSMLLNTTGSFNTAMGYDAMSYSTTSGNNTSIGAYSMYNNSGAYNAAVGTYAGYYTSTNSSFLGWFARGPQAGVTNSTAIGYNTVVTGDNQVRIGNGSVTSIGGPVGWSVISDGRFKKDITENVPGLAFINKLRPVTYNFDAAAFNKKIGDISANKNGVNNTQNEDRSAATERSKVLYTGFIAQEVEAVAKKMNYSFSGIDAPKNENDYYGLRYSDFVVPLVKAVQELSLQNDSLKKENEQLKAQNALFEERFKKIESALKLNTSSVLSLSNASIEQNSPNPFSTSTTISYKLPANRGKAQIIIYDAGGRMLKQYNLQAQESGTIRIDATMLPAGTYNYALSVNGNIIETKKMVLTK